MNVHGSAWLSAYYDGELHGVALQQFEDHLSQCSECRVELDGLGTLTRLLQVAPAARPQRSAQSVQAQVIRRLPPLRPYVGRRNALKTAWQLAPLAAVAAWAFTQAALLVTGLALLPGQAGLLGQAGLSLALIGGSNLFGLASALPGLEWGWSALGLGLLNLALTALLAVFLSGWIASWWIYRHQREENYGFLRDRTIPGAW